MKVFLVGFMGAGKTTLGKQLAQQMGYSFIDTDQLIEEQLHTTIPLLFEEKGEKAFRNIETQTLHSLSDKTNTVIATGGGLPCFNNNMPWMNKNGITIYIKQDIEELYNRLKTERNTRPLLKSAANHALKGYIEGLLTPRIPFYTQAKYVFSGPFVSPETVINTVFL